MYSLLADAYVVYAKFTLVGKMIAAIGEDYDGYSRAVLCVDRAVGKVIRDHRLDHGIPEVGIFIETHRHIGPHDPQLPWLNMMYQLRSNPVVLWTTENHDAGQDKEVS